MPDIWTKRSDGSTVWGTREDNGSTPSTGASGWATWTQATRPTASLVVGQLGYNTDFKGFEHWNGTKWKIMSGTWTVDTRPLTANIAPGSKGFNSDTGIGNESWDGSNWVSI